MSVYSTLIFDIGNVIIDIDYQKVVSAFEGLSEHKFTDILSYSSQHPIFDDFETGKIDASGFRNEIRQFLLPDTSDDQIDAAWNAMLVNYPVEKFQLLQALKSTYRILALSNINEIHAYALDKSAKMKLGAKDFRSFFHKVYYSHEIGFRKPQPEVYGLLLKSEEVDPSKCFFVDDKPENVQSAIEAGINAKVLEDRNRLVTLLKENQIL